MEGMPQSQERTSAAGIPASSGRVARFADTVAPPASSRGFRGVALLWGVVVALLVRVALAAASIGTNDALTFAEFAKEVRMVGVVETYRLDPYFNHPPLVGLWAAAVLGLLKAPFVPLQMAFPPNVTYAFSFLFKLPIIAADALAAWLLFKRWRPRLGKLRATAVAAAFAASVGSILVGAFHCNTDPAYAMLCLAAVYLLEEKQAFFLGGVVLGAAINVKIIPLLLVPPLLLSCSSRQQARAFVLGLSAAAVPFLPVICRDFSSFYENVLAYNPPSNGWGINAFLMLGTKIGIVARWAARAATWYHLIGRYLLLLLVAAWAAAARRWQRWNRYELAAMTLAIFMVFTPGFGVQYIVPVGLLLFAARPRVAAAYAIASGAFLLEVYLARSDGLRLPVLILLITRLSSAEALLGLPAWGILVYFLTTTLFRRPTAPVAATSQDPAVPASLLSPLPAAA